MTDLTPLIVAALAFGAIAGVAFVAGQAYVRSAQLYRRLPVLQGAAGDVGSTGSAVAGLVARHFDEKRFGVDDTLRGRLRLNLVRAGYFRRDAINFYVFWRLAAAALMPILAYLVLGIAIDSFAVATSVGVMAGLGLGVIGPDAFISRRQRLLSAEYRSVFPDFLDLLVVCVDAGLSVEGALDRITAEITKRSRVFRDQSRHYGRGDASGASLRRGLGHAGESSDDTGSAISRCDSAAIIRTRQRCRGRPSGYSVTNCATSACCGRRKRPANYL